MKLLRQKHIAYVQSLGKSTDELSYHLSAHLRLNAIYWGLTALYILGAQDALDREETIAFVLSCWDEEEGGFGAHPGHDAHILPTTSAIQILLMQGAEDRLEPYIERITNFIVSLQTPKGSFKGDKWGEIDTRFLYCSVNALSLLGTLHAKRDGSKSVNVDAMVDYLKRCRNFDGGFGSDEGAESHAAQVFTCVGALAILDRLDVVYPNGSDDVNDMLGWWLAERQLPSGGLNGRPEKLADVCYSFWVLSALAILRKVHWIDADKLVQFILSAQDVSDDADHSGGIADRPGDVSDVFHTNFGLAGLSLLGYPELRDIDPVYCMPASLIEKKGLKKNWAALPRRSPNDTEGAV